MTAPETTAGDSASPRHPSVLDIVCECLQLIQELPTKDERDAACEILINIKRNCPSIFAKRKGGVSP